MANEQRGEIEIKIGGKLRKMRFGFNEMAQVEQRLDGRSILRMMAEKNFGMWAIRESLYVGLSVYMPKLTPERVGEWLGEDMANLGYYAAMVGQAVRSFMPVDNTTEESEVAAPLDPAQEVQAEP